MYSLLFLSFFSCSEKRLPHSASEGFTLHGSSFLLTKQDISHVKEKSGNYGCEWHFYLTPSASKKFFDYTASAIDSTLEIKLYDKVVSSPIIREPIRNGVATVFWEKPCSRISTPRPSPPK